MPVTKAPDWETIKNKPTTVAGLGLSDFVAKAIEAQASGAVGGVGTFAFLRLVNAINQVPGTTQAASNLQYASDSATSGTPAVPSGTWRMMGGTNASSSASTVWVRIS